jgi:bacterioferritin-associated ferredoxin
MYVCLCNAVTEREIRQVIGLGVTSLRELSESLGVATGCGKCSPCANAILSEALRGAAGERETPRGGMKVCA